MEPGTIPAAITSGEAGFRVLFEEIPVPLYRTTPSGRIIAANRALAELLGFDSIDELLDRNALEFFVAPAERDRSGAILEKESVVNGFEEELIRKDGVRIWVADSSRIIRDEKGEVVCYEGALIDITQRRRAEVHLSARARQQWAVAELGQLALAGTPLPQVFTDAAKSVRRVLAVDAARIRVSGEEVAISGVIPAGDHVLADASGNGGSSVEGASWSAVGGGSGGMRVPLVGADGVIGILTAYSSRPRQFARDDANFLQAVGNVLAAAVESAHSRDRLEELVRSKDEFLAGVSHELRTPLTAVVGFASELRRTWSQVEESAKVAMIDTIATQSQEMADIIEDLLVASRADLGALHLQVGPVRLMEQVGHVLDGFPRSDSSRVSFRGRAAVAWADPARVRQILRNLVSNALRYGGPGVEIRVVPGETEVALEVCDDGAGIRSEDREAIFEAYHRAHETQGDQPASVGIGLTVSRQLALLMGGGLDYRYEGQSVFRLVLPAAPDVSAGTD